MSAENSLQRALRAFLVGMAASDLELAVKSFRGRGAWVKRWSADVLRKGPNAGKIRRVTLVVDLPVDADDLPKPLPEGVRFAITACTAVSYREAAVEKLPRLPIESQDDPIELLGAMVRAWDRHVGKPLVKLGGGVSTLDRARALVAKAGGR